MLMEGRVCVTVGGGALRPAVSGASHFSLWHVSLPPHNTNSRLGFVLVSGEGSVTSVHLFISVGVPEPGFQNSGPDLEIILP